MEQATNNFMQSPFVDVERISQYRRAIIKAYAEKDARAVENAAKGIQAYIDEGGDIDYHIDDALEDYQGGIPEKLADKYILRVLHDRHLDGDTDQDYIATGLTQFQRTLFQAALVKKEHPAAIVLFRCGDFYESYEEDAAVCAKVLSITLTRRSGNNVQMARFPYHALDTYLPKLIRKGHSVAICDMPKASTRKLAKGGITELITPYQAQQPKPLPKKPAAPIQLSLNFTF